MTIEEKKDFVRKNIMWQSTDIPKGGQSTSPITCDVTLVSDELGIKIYINSHISQLRNRELALCLFEKVLEDVTNPQLRL